ncbi:PIR Superfamily Protein [Plasmodium ovale curtisi]|uniref:PIR Superfamily Protein n=1 Tax=Plasmodium ovale curtisi TaxID=864141 RepID=A0A1A8WSW9_PLAOA|nr:PIR Superfamily Protein [Plasmodium ovale curtisi]
MPEVTKEADPDFFKKLTKETLSTNEPLKKYYYEIESIYKGNFEFSPGSGAKNEAYEVLQVTRDDQDTHSGDSLQNNGADMFTSKFPYAIEPLFTYYNSALLKHEPKKGCVYFKYWFYDKILKNILSDDNLNDFYNDIQSGDEDDEDGDKNFFKENKENELVEVYMDGEEEEEEEEDVVDGSLLKEEDDDSAESKDVEAMENQHRSRDEDYGGNNILLSLGNSNKCNIYKLKLNQIIDIKLLYDYFENYDDRTKRTNVEKKIIENKYCDSFNNLIELYNKNVECKSDESDNKYCHELEECRKNYSHTNIPEIICTVAESASGSPEQDATIKHFQVISQLPLPRHETGSAPFGGLLEAETKSSKASMGTEEMGSTAQHKGHTIDEKQTSDNAENFAESGQAHSQMSSSDTMRGSLTMDFKSSTSCHHGSVGRSCESSSQPLAPMSTVTENHSKQPPPKNTAVHTEPDVSLQEETGNTNTIVSSASSVLGVSALLFMLYKFTPLGSLINNRRGGMDTWDINEEGYDENLLFSPELGNTNSNNNNYSIGYYSLGNT